MESVLFLMSPFIRPSFTHSPHGLVICFFVMALRINHTREAGTSIRYFDRVQE